MPINCRQFQLCRATSPCGNQHSKPDKPAAVESWLRSLARDPLTMVEIRNVAVSFGALNRSDNEASLKSVAQLISSGQLLVCKRPAAAGGGGGGASGGPVYFEKPFPLSERQPSSSSSSNAAAADPATFSDQLDGKSQADALNSAAAEGMPFCPE